MTNRDLKILNFNSTNFTTVYTEVEVEERWMEGGGGSFLWFIRLLVNIFWQVCFSTSRVPLQCFLGSNIIIIFQQISKPFIATAIIGLKINIRLHCKINRGVIRGVIVK